MFTTDEARALAAALDDAGLEQDELLNAFQLDYQFDYHDESRDTVVHIVFSFAGCEAMPDAKPRMSAREVQGEQPPQTEPSR